MKISVTYTTVEHFKSHVLLKYNLTTKTIRAYQNKRIGNYLLEKLKGEKWPELSLAAHPKAFTGCDRFA